MQQTRVAQGTPYYLRFVEAYPTVADLAAAPQDDVLRLWQGLGYYSQARNMHAAAQYIIEHHDGKFPTAYKDVLALKGVGKYTAAAIMSFAFGESYPVVDGNVLRVISRLHGITDPIDDTKTINTIYELSTGYITGVDPADYNQAIMDFGAMMCKPKSPSCTECPFADECIAKAENTIETIPYKAKKIKKTTRHLHYFLVEDDDANMIIRHRTGKGIWQGLYDMPFVENKAPDTLSYSIIKTALSDINIDNVQAIDTEDRLHKHLLSHQTLFARFYKVRVDTIPELEPPLIKVRKDALDKYGMPVLITKFLAERDLFS